MHWQTRVSRGSHGPLRAWHAFPGETSGRPGEAGGSYRTPRTPRFEHTLFFPRERLKRSQKSSKVEGPEPAAAEASLSAEQGTMTEVKVKTELPDDYIQEVIWQGETKEEKKAVSKDGAGDVPAEICVVIGGVRNQQTLGEWPSGRWHTARWGLSGGVAGALTWPLGSSPLQRLAFAPLVLVQSVAVPVAKPCQTCFRSYQQRLFCMPRAALAPWGAQEHRTLPCHWYPPCQMVAAPGASCQGRCPERMGSGTDWHYPWPLLLQLREISSSNARREPSAEVSGSSLGRF